MSEEDYKISENALQWIKDNERFLIKTFANPDGYETDTTLISLFMAGSPGAGKTEVSKRLIQRFQKKPVRIDADEIRALCPEYKGEQAHIFQKAATKGVNILYDHILHKNLNVILDGTFAYGDALNNIERSLAKNRKVEVFFIYQNPATAWEFTKKREELEKRRVSKEVFLKGFFGAQANVNEAKKVFGNRIELNLIIKNFEKGFERLELNIEKIDPYLDKQYNRQELSTILL